MTLGESQASSKSSPPLVAIVCDSLPPYRVRVHRRLLAELPEARFATLCTHEPTAGGAWETVPQEQVPHESFGQGDSPLARSRLSSIAGEWAKGGRIIGWLKQNRAAAVIVNGYNDPGRLRILRWCGRQGIPVFCWADSNIQGDTASGMKALVKKQLVGWVVRTCFGVMPFGSPGAAYYRKYGASPDRIFYVPMEPDYDRIHPGPVERSDTDINAFGFAPTRKRLLYSGRLAPEKRVDLAIHAFLAIAEQRPQWDLVIMGDGPLRDELKSLVPAEKASRVFWTGGIRESSKVYALYPACDVLVLPSDFEPWALVVNEAAAAGLAIVCTDVVGAAAELVRDQVNGRVFPKGNLGLLTDALIDVTSVDVTSIDVKLPEKLSEMKRASLRVLAEWRVRGDPVQGVRRALQTCGVL